MQSEVQARVIARLRRRGATMADLAARTGRPYSDVRRSLRAPHAWRLDRLFDYARALEADPRDLLPPRPFAPDPIETPDLRRDGTPADRIRDAYAAGLAVRALGRIGAARRRRSK